MFNFIRMSVTNIKTSKREIIEVEIPKGGTVSSSEVLNFIMGCNPVVFEVNHHTNEIIGTYKINFYSNHTMQIAYSEFREQPINYAKYQIGPYILNNFNNPSINKQEKYIKEEYETFLEKHKFKEEKQDSKESDLYDEILF